jgi:hypothetical protein
VYVHYAVGVALAALTCFVARFMSRGAERGLFTAIMIVVGAGFVWFPLAVGHHAGTVNELLAGAGFVAMACLSLRWPVLLPLAFLLHGTWDMGYLTEAVDSHKPLWLVQLCVPYDGFVAVYLLIRWYNLRPAGSASGR